MFNRPVFSSYSCCSCLIGLLSALPALRTAFAQPAKQAHYSTVEFDQTAKALPPQFDGHDCVRIFSTLEKVAFSRMRGEFETTEEWQKRLSAEERQPLAGDLSRSSTYAFLVEHNGLSGRVRTAYPGYSIAYDADKSAFRIDISTEPMRDTSGLTLQATAALPVVSTGHSRTYLGSNALGAVREVQEHTITQYQLSILSLDGFRLAGSPSVHVDVPMRREEAMSAKEQIRVLAISRLLEPFLYTGAWFTHATVDSPTEIHYTYKYLKVEVVAFWVFNYQSGAVYRILQSDPSRPSTQSVAMIAQSAQPIRQQPAPTRHPAPIYPALARQARIQGTVRFKVVIAKDGSINKIVLLSGHPLLVPAAREVLKQWLYAPTIVNGEGVEVETEVEVPFTLK